jgi:alpha-ketoglutarate-dependent taurine dioxygenase
MPVAGSGTGLTAGPPPTVETTAEDAAGWLSAHRDGLREKVLAHGAVLVRGLRLAGWADAVRVSRALVPDVMAEREGFAPRDRLDDGVYSSMRWPADQPMCMHHELSYRRRVPGLLVLTCLAAPDRGGATGLADAAAVLGSLPDDLVDRAESAGWRLTRTFGGPVGLSLEDVFGSGDRAVVEDYCRDNGIDCRWDRAGELSTSQRRPAVVSHPRTGVRCWFNQLAFLNEWTMDPAVREFLLEQLGPDGLPFNTAYGDGRPVDERTVRAINDTYEQHTYRHHWRAGDVLLVDNIRMAHSREPFAGPRDLVVAMGDPVTLTDG